eukprot:GSChrysophyteH2.ASY1.ANO1.711.1 assembled CDS
MPAKKRKTVVRTATSKRNSASATTGKIKATEDNAKGRSHVSKTPTKKKPPTSPTKVGQHSSAVSAPASAPALVSALALNLPRSASSSSSSSSSGGGGGGGGRRKDDALPPSPPLPPPGLRNLGNTCFLNAVMQALTHCRSLAEAVANSGHSHHCQHEKGSCVLCSVEAHMHQCAEAWSFAPKNIVRTLPQISTTLRLGRQEDAHEFLRNLVSGMQSSLLDITSSSSNSSKHEDYPVTLFEGSVQCLITCGSCGAVSTKRDPVEDLELDISRASSLHGALHNEFGAPEELTGDNAYFCDRCQQKVMLATKSHRIQQVPPVLTVQLKRFSYELRDASSSRAKAENTSTPTSASASAAASAAASVRAEDSKFARLFALVVHQGNTITSGHYVAFVRADAEKDSGSSADSEHGEGSWYRMDDARVTPCGAQEAMAQCAYILFYERCDHGSDIQLAKSYCERVVAEKHPVTALGSPVGSPRSSFPAYAASITTNAGASGDGIERSREEGPTPPASLISRIFGSRGNKRRKDQRSTGGTASAVAPSASGWFW